MDKSTFKEMTKLTPENYASVAIDGVKYQVKYKLGECYLIRLGVKMRP